MKLIILVDELKYEPGIYGYDFNIEEIETPIKDKLLTASQILSSVLGISSGTIATSSALRIGASTLGRLTPLGLGVTGLLLASTVAKKSYDIFKQNEEAIKGTWGLQQTLTGIQSFTDIVPEIGYMNSSISVLYNTIGGRYKTAFDRPEFYGAFKNRKEMQKVLEADGSNSEIIVMSVDTAHKYFKHIGQGIFALGKYVSHPKKLNVLVPFESFHSIILKELDEEYIRVFSTLGAKKINIQTLEGVSIDGSVVVPVKGKARAEYERTREGEKTYEFFPEADDIESVLDNKVWVQDYPPMQTFIETRKSHRLKRFEETVNVDTSFGLDVDVILQFNGTFKWEKTSKYRYEVEFYSKKELGIA